MRYQKRRRLYSQNFLRDPELISRLIRNSSIGRNDTVLEIGPGTGIITRELVKVAGKVIAIELDRNLFLQMKSQFGNFSNLQLSQADFLDFELPEFPYKIFANIPFSITAEIVRKITSDRNLKDAYLIVQAEAAKNFIGKPYDFRNSQAATLLKPWYEVSICHMFRRRDFIPEPRVDAVMIRILKRSNPLIAYALYEQFRYFVLYSYNRHKLAKLETEKIIDRFINYVNNANRRYKYNVTKEAGKLIKQQQKLIKIRRTRLDSKWRNF